MRSLKLDKDLLRTATGPDLEYATGLRPLDTPTPDFVNGASTPSIISASVLSELVSKPISDSIRQSIRDLSEYTKRPTSFFPTSREPSSRPKP